MQLLTFPSRREYVKAQGRADRSKSPRSSATEPEIVAIVNWLKSADIEVKRGLCHGARHGVEVDLFAKHLPHAEITGTDLFKREHPKVIEHDFHLRRDDFVGAFQFVYSNSLDHSHSPEDCLKVWLEQLTFDGVLILEWCTYHITTGRYGGDCFGATLHEYIAMLEKLAHVRDIKYVGDVCGCSMCVLIADATRKGWRGAQ